MRIKQKLLDKYQKLAGELDGENVSPKTLDKDEAFNSFQSRLHGMGVDYVSGNFRTTGMYRAPHSRELNGVDIVCVGLPLDRGVPFDRVGTRQGPQALRYWSNSEGGFHELTGFNVFEECSVIDWGDVAFSESGFDLVANIAEISELYTKFRSKILKRRLKSNSLKGLGAVFNLPLPVLAFM